MHTCLHIHTHTHTHMHIHTHTHTHTRTRTQAAIDTLRGALASGMDWTELGRLVREERRRGSEVAMAIDDVCFEKNQVTLRDIYIYICVCVCVCVYVDGVGASCEGGEEERN